jgi:hypothetical protein
VLHYLRASAIEIGLIINFGPNARFRRVEMRNERKRRMSSETLELPDGVGR